MECSLGSLPISAEEKTFDLLSKPKRLVARPIPLHQIVQDAWIRTSAWCKTRDNEWRKNRRYRPSYLYTCFLECFKRANGAFLCPDPCKKEAMHAYPVRTRRVYYGPRFPSRVCLEILFTPSLRASSGGSPQSPEPSEKGPVETPSKTRYSGRISPFQPLDRGPETHHGKHILRRDESKVPPCPHGVSKTHVKAVEEHLRATWGNNPTHRFYAERFVWNHRCYVVFFVEQKNQPFVVIDASEDLGTTGHPVLSPVCVSPHVLSTNKAMIQSVNCVRLEDLTLFYLETLVSVKEAMEQDVREEHPLARSYLQDGFGAWKQNIRQKDATKERMKQRLEQKRMAKLVRKRENAKRWREQRRASQRMVHAEKSVLPKEGDFFHPSKTPEDMPRRVSLDPEIEKRMSMRERLKYKLRHICRMKWEVQTRKIQSPVEVPSLSQPTPTGSTREKEERKESFVTEAPTDPTQRPAAYHEEQSESGPVFDDQDVKSPGGDVRTPLFGTRMEEVGAAGDEEGEDFGVQDRSPSNDEYPPEWDPFILSMGDISEFVEGWETMNASSCFMEDMPAL
mmetsp:Transcript_29151/g.74965  ORF Transcript_29151/g.74965 Transcript_29151/m.74965 type:complete len:564 (-) Transcript_29151:3723-5414(-)